MQNCNEKWPARPNCQRTSTAQKASCGPSNVSQPNPAAAAAASFRHHSQSLVIAPQAKASSTTTTPSNSSEGSVQEAIHPSLFPQTDIAATAVAEPTMAATACAGVGGFRVPPLLTSAAASSMWLWQALQDPLHSQGRGCLGIENPCDLLSVGVNISPAAPCFAPSAALLLPLLLLRRHCSQGGACWCRWSADRCSCWVQCCKCWLSHLQR